MSKCQINKYRPGGRCGGETSTYSEKNTGFDSSLTKLLQRREEQDKLFEPIILPTVAAATATAIKTLPKQSTSIVTMNAVNAANAAIKRNVVKKTQSPEDIDLLLQGDYAE